MKILIILLSLFSANLCQAQKSGSWGDQGNGTFINPVLNADYSDPDVIRVGEKYYMVCSEFHYMGMTIQESDDMINWRIIGRIYNRLDFSAYEAMSNYGNGSWAPSIRYHDKKFWVYFCTPGEGLFMTFAREAKGPWQPLSHVVKIKGWEDPCPFWDENGDAYLGHSIVGAGPIIIHRMSPNGMRILDTGKVVYRGPVAEGTKFHKRNGYYYLSIPEGGVARGWQTVLRSKNIYGPYERKIVLETGDTEINGPHQGAMVETPKGAWWFYHFQLSGALGRVMHLQPVQWKDDWPFFGVDIDRNGIGEPVYAWKKPDVGAEFPIEVPKTDDEFSGNTLGLQWQWNHNPVDTKWSLSDKPGWLSLYALRARTLKTARNTLTQKIMGSKGEVVIRVNTSRMAIGQRAGLCSISKVFSAVGAVNNDGHINVYFEGDEKTKIEVPVGKRDLYFKMVINMDEHEVNYFYGFDQKKLIPIGTKAKVRWGDWKGARIGLFSYNENGDEGKAEFDFVHYTHDGPGH